MLFGDKEKFGIYIEFEKDTKKYAYIALYINNLYIGTLEEVTYIESAMATLNGYFIDRITKLPEKYKNLSCEELFKLRYPDDEWADYPEELESITANNIEDTFDPFCIISYKLNDEEIVFCWKLDWEDFRDKTYPKGIHSAKFNYAYVKNIFEQAINYVAKEV